MSCLVVIVAADGQHGIGLINDLGGAPGYGGIGPGPISPGPIGAGLIGGGFLGSRYGQIPLGGGPVGQVPIEVSRPGPIGIQGPIAPLPLAGPVGPGFGGNGLGPLPIGPNRPYGLGPIGLGVGAPFPPPIQPAPLLAPGPIPAYGNGPISPPNYQFAYGVQNDGYNGIANFGHNEQRNGYTTTGQYHVDLPGVSSQSVSYTVGGAPYGPSPIL